jgi:hypothetical protein
MEGVSQLSQQRFTFEDTYPAKGLPGAAKRKALARRRSAAVLAAGLLEAEKKFRRIKGYQEILQPKERLNPSCTQQKEVRTAAVA